MFLRTNVAPSSPRHMATRTFLFDWLDCSNTALVWRVVREAAGNSYGILGIKQCTVTEKAAVQKWQSLEVEQSSETKITRPQKQCSPLMLVFQGCYLPVIHGSNLLELWRYFSVFLEAHLHLEQELLAVGRPYLAKCFQQQYRNSMFAHPWIWSMC